MSRLVFTASTTTHPTCAHLHRCAVLHCLRESGQPLSIEQIGDSTRLTPDEVITAVRALQREWIIESPERNRYGFPSDEPIEAPEWSHAA